MTKLRQLAGETVLYGVGSIGPRVLNFLLLPLHTIHMFSRAEYGVIVTLLAMVAFANVVYLFGMETAYFRFATKPGADQKRIFNLAQTVVFLISVCLSIVLIYFSSPIATSAGIGDHPEFITWIVITMLIDALVAIPFARLRLEKKALRFASFKILNVLVLVLLNYYFLKVAYDPAVGIGYVMLSNLIANALFILFFGTVLLAWRPAYDAEITPAMFRYAYPVMLTGLAGMTNEMFSRFMLDRWLPEGFYSGMTKKDALGIFGACYKYAVFMNLIVQAFRYAAEPFFFSNAPDKKSAELFATVNHYFVVVCCFFLVGISINLDILKFIMGEEFRDGLLIVPILLLAYLFLGIYYNVSIWFKLTDRTYYGTIITVVGAIVTIVGNYFLIPVAGYLGSSWAALLCYFTMMALCYWIGQKKYPIPYRVWNDLAYISVSMLLVYGVNAVAPDSLLAAFGFHAIVLLLFGALIYYFEKKGLKQVS